MKSIVVLAVILLTSASIFSKQLDLYFCEKIEDGANCSRSCSKSHLSETRPKVDFDINYKDRMVLSKFYSKGILDSSSVQENCKIFNDKNWDCSTSIFIPKGPWTVHQIDRMTDGIWTRFSYTTPETKFNDKTSICAK